MIMILGPFKCLFPEYPQYHSFLKWQQKTTARQTRYRTISVHMYGGGNNNFDRDMEKPGRSGHFPEKDGMYVMVLHNVRRH